MNSTHRAIALTGGVIAITLGLGLAVTRFGGGGADGNGGGAKDASVIPGIPPAPAPPEGPADARDPASPARGAPAEGASAAVADPETDGHRELPLRKRGLGGAEELVRALARTDDPRVKAHFERGFRQLFTTREDLRHAGLAATELKAAIDVDAGFEPAYRVLGEALWVQRMDFHAAVPQLEKAIELREDYGEAHYGLAFLYSRSPHDEDRAKGRRHFRRARQLGIPDDKGLAPTYDIP